MATGAWQGAHEERNSGGGGGGDHITRIWGAIVNVLYTLLANI